MKATLIPDEVFDVFNELIAASFTGHSARVLQKDVVARLADIGITERQALDNNWLDVEPVYEDNGWSVTYDKPMGYAGESYDANFTFEVKRGMSR